MGNPEDVLSFCEKTLQKSITIPLKLTICLHNTCMRMINHFIFLLSKP